MGERFNATTRYGVFPTGDTWTLFCDGIRLWAYEDRAAAIQAAERAAQQALGGGFAPELHILDHSELVRLSPGAAAAATSAGSL